LTLSSAFLFASNASAANFYWDSDLTAAGNNSLTGDGLGGSGEWDNLNTLNWWDGTSGTDTTWDDTANSGAIFYGGGGVVNLTTPRTAGSLTFKVGGFSVVGSTLNLSSPATISVEGSGISADISSILAGTNGYSLAGGGQ